MEQSRAYVRHIRMPCQVGSVQVFSLLSSATLIPNQKGNRKTIDQEHEKGIKEAREVMTTVPRLVQRIAGKFIPLEKLAARKAQKYTAQAGLLLLPVFELGYVSTRAVRRAHQCHTSANRGRSRVEALPGEGRGVHAGV
jgi:hypothetical protein